MQAQQKAPTLKNLLSVGEVAARSGVSVATLHFYESKGLITSVRNAGNQRQFPRSVLRVVSLIKVSQYLGFSLEEIKGHLKTLPQNHTPRSSDWKELTKKWNQELEDRIQLLKLMQTQLQNCIGCGCMSLRDCPLRNPQDKYGKKGTGGRILLEKIGK